MNIKVDVDDLEPERQNMQTGMLATESVQCQEVILPRVSATSAASGSASCPQTEDLHTHKEEIFPSIVKDSFHTMKPQSIEEWNQFMEYAKEMKVIIVGVSEDALSSEFHSTSSTSESPLTKEQWEKSEQKTKIMETAKLEGASSSEFHSISSTSESPQNQEELKKWKQKTKIVETEKLKVTSSPSDMFITSHEREQKELPKTMRLQERKESAGFQKDPHQKASVASATVGSLVHTGTKDFQTMEDKILSLIQSNYLQTTLQQSAEDRDEFQEYLEKLATGVPVEGCLVISVGCDSLENLEGVVRRLLIWHS